MRTWIVRFIWRHPAHGNTEVSDYWRGEAEHVADAQARALDSSRIPLDSVTEVVAVLSPHQLREGGA